MTKWILSLALMVASLSAFAQPVVEGGISGGGGSFVETPNSRTLVFWDIFINAPGFSESQPGDQLALRPRRISAKTGNIGDWIDYRELKSFEFLKTRLRKWQMRAPNLVSVVTKTGVGNLLDEAHLSEPGNYPGYYSIADNPRFHFLILATPLYLQDFQEIEVPSNIDLTGVRAYPTAYYRNHVILLNMTYFNRAGLKSQAAMLLHEKLRNIQSSFKVSNAQLQKIVYDIIAREPEDVTESEFNDRLFAPANSNGSGMSIMNELTYYEFESAFDCMYTPSPLECAKRQGVFGYTKGLITKDSDLMTADEQVAIFARENTLGAAPSGARLRSTGRLTTPLIDRTPAPTAATGLILNTQNCPAVYAKHRLGEATMWYGQAPCDPNAGFITFSHTFVGMEFSTPVRSELNLQVTGATYSGNDGGSAFGVETMGLKVRLHNQGVLYLFGDNNQFIGSQLKLGREEAMKEHKYVFRFLFAKRRIDVVLNDDGNFRTNPVLASWNLPDNVPATLSKVSWKIELYQNVNISAIEILPGPATPDSAGDPFENWKAKNASGVNYVSAPNKRCRKGYRSIFFDQMSNRHECESIPAYFPKEGERCASDFLSLIVDGRRICQNSRTYPSYWPLQGDLCAPGYTDVGFEAGDQGKMWRSCVNTKRVDRYVIRNLSLHCDPAFREKRESWRNSKWISCTR